MNQQTVQRNTILLIESADFTLRKEWTINPSHLDTFRTIFGHYVRLLRGQDSSYSLETEDDGTCFTLTFQQGKIGHLREIIYIHYWYNYDDVQSVTVDHTRWDNGKKSLNIQWDLNFDRDNKNSLYSIGLTRGDLLNRKNVWAYKYNKPFDY